MLCGRCVSNAPTIRVKWRNRTQERSGPHPMAWHTRALNARGALLDNNADTTTLRATHPDIGRQHTTASSSR
jgi:hypothetical protein